MNAETDFVAKNPDFIAFAQARGGAGGARRTRPTWPRSPSLKIGGETVEAARQKLVQKIGENITVRRFERIAVERQARRTTCTRAPRSRVLVDLEGDEAVAKDVAMHIAFAKPQLHVEGPVSPPT